MPTELEEFEEAFKRAYDLSLVSQIPDGTAAKPAMVKELRFIFATGISAGAAAMGKACLFGDKESAIADRVLDAWKTFANVEE